MKKKVSRLSSLYEFWIHRSFFTIKRQGIWEIRMEMLKVLRNLMFVSKYMNDYTIWLLCDNLWRKIFNFCYRYNFFKGNHDTKLVKIGDNILFKSFFHNQIIFFYSNITVLYFLSCESDHTVKVKAWPTKQPTNQPTDRPTDTVIGRVARKKIQLLQYISFHSLLVFRCVLAFL